MVIIPVTREVSFQGFLFKATTFMLELFNIIIKPQDLWTIYRNPCFKRGMLVQNVSVMLKQSESASMLSQFTLAHSIEEAISAENLAISIFLSLRKVSSLHDKACHGKPIGH